MCSQLALALVLLAGTSSAAPITYQVNRGNGAIVGTVTTDGTLGSWTPTVSEDSRILFHVLDWDLTFSTGERLTPANPSYGDSSYAGYPPNITATAEPGTAALLGICVLVMAAMRRRG